MFDWSKYLRLSEQLMNSTGEENKRTAVSRAYYSVYRRAHIFLEEKDLAPDTKNSKKTHELIWKSFEKLGKKGNDIAEAGLRLRDRRVEADYHNDVKNIGKWTTSAILDAQFIEKLLNEISKK